MSLPDLEKHIQELTDYLANTHNVSRKDLLLFVKAWEIRLRERKLEHETRHVCISREKLLKKKQGWLEASKEHPFQHCRVCTIEDINKLLGLDIDAEKEVEEYDEKKKKEPEE